MLSTRIQTRLACLFFLIIILASGKSGIRGYDSVSRFNAGVLKIFPEANLSGPTNEKYNSSLSLLSSPLLLLGIASAGYPDVQNEKKLRSYTAHFNHLLLFLLCVWLLFFFMREQGWSLREAFVGVAVFLSCSLSLAHSLDFYSEFLWSAGSFIVLALLNLPHTRSRSLQLGVFTFVSAWVNPVLLPLFTVVYVCHAILQRSLKTFVWGTSACFFSLVPSGIENLLQRGSFFSAGYGSESFLWQPEVYLYLLGAPGKGLLWFMPALFLFPLVWHGRSVLVQHILSSHLVYGLGLYALYGAWWCWDGAIYWGPRFFLVLSMFGAFYAANILHEDKGWVRLLAIATVLWSASLNSLGFVFGQRYYDQCQGPSTECSLGWVYSPFYFLTQKDWTIADFLYSRGMWSIIVLLMVILALSRSQHITHNFH